MSKRKRGPKRPLSPDPDAYELDEFCMKNRMSRGAWYRMPPERRPKVIHVGRKIIISKEAAVEWRQRESK